MSHVLASAAGMLALLGAAGAAERRLPASAGGCDQKVLAAGQREPLSRVMKQLAERHDFRLEYWTTEDPQVLHGGGVLVELMTSLSRQANMMVRYVPHLGCPGRWKVAVVWVLPTGPATPTLSPAVVSAPPAPDPDAEAFIRAHGITPPGQSASAPAPPGP